MASPASGRILNLLQEVVSIVEQEQRGTPINAVPLPTFQAPMPTVNQNSTQNSPVSVLAELRSRFQPYPSAPSQRFRVAGRSAGRRALFTTRLWSNKFFCLGFPESDKTPNSAQRLYLTTNLLGESVITSEANATSAELSSKIVEQFPKLTGVNFELMRCVGAGGYGKPLVRVSSSNPVPDVAYLKVSRISTIYIRPERPLLRVEEEEDNDVEMNETSTTTETPIASTSTRDQERNIGTFANATTSTTSLNLADQTWIDMELPTINNFQSQVISLNPGLQVIRVFRDNFYERLFGVYKDPNLNLAKELKVEFLGEAGADYGALKREFFWKGFISLTSEKLHGRALFEGEKDYLVPAADSLLLRTGVFRFVGKFIAHAAIHCGIGFLGLSEAVGEYLTTDEVTPDTPFSITINDLPDPDHKASIEYIRKLQSGATLGHHEAAMVQELALTSDFLDIVTRSNAEEAIVQILYHQVIERRKQYLDVMKDSMKATGLLSFISKHPYLRSGVFPRMNDVNYPLSVVLDRVQYNGNEVVVNHVKDYLSGLNEDHISALLKAWTGWSIIPETKLKITVEKDVEFSAATCFEEIFVPDNFTKEDVKTWFDLLLSNPEGFGNT